MDVLWAMEEGFPESHAAPFALLVHVSAWMKCHYPGVFGAALLNSQPMGFYAPAQIVRDMGQLGLQVRPPYVNYSDWDSTLEPVGTGDFAVRLGLRQIGGFPAQAAARIMAARDAPYRDIDDLKVRAGLTALIIRRLAEADAHADEVSRPMSHPLVNPDAGQHEHPRNLRIIPKSRDLH